MQNCLILLLDFCFPWFSPRIIICFNLTVDLALLSGTEPQIWYSSSQCRMALARAYAVGLYTEDGQHVRQFFICALLYLSFFPCSLQLLTSWHKSFVISSFFFTLCSCKLWRENTNHDESMAGGGWSGSVGWRYAPKFGAGDGQGCSRSSHC